MEALFRASLTEGRDLADRRTLIDVAAGTGLDRAEAEVVLAGDAGLGEIRETEQIARRHGVDGVPFFVVNGQGALAGAQHPDAFLAAFRRASGWEPK